jgi:hypothetical protein
MHRRKFLIGALAAPAITPSSLMALPTKSVPTGPLTIGSFASGQEAWNYLLARNWHLRNCLVTIRLALATFLLACCALPAWAQSPREIPNDVVTPGAVASTNEAEVCAVTGDGTY